jgi:hypothetical protein
VWRLEGNVPPVTGLSNPIFKGRTVPTLRPFSFPGFENEAGHVNSIRCSAKGDDPHVHTHGLYWRHSYLVHHAAGDPVER